MRHIARLFEADISIILDLAPLPHRNKDSFIYRNRIVDRIGSPVWLSLPICRKGGKVLKDAVIDPTNRVWVDKHIGSISHAYPRHKVLAKGFLERLRDKLIVNNGTLLDINLKSMSIILETLNYKDIDIRLQSSIVNNHNIDHRYEIYRSLNATSYIAGQVEWSIMCEDNAAGNTENSLMHILRSPDLDSNKFPLDLTVTLSCVHAICSKGIDKTRDIIDAMLKSLKASSSKSVVA
jgi:hypothetical protein